MEDIIFSARSYCKMILHAAKYPHCAIDGILLADDTKYKESKGKGLYISEVIPLFHVCLHVTPMPSLALFLVNDMAVKSGMVVAGYYTANENIKDTNHLGHPIAGRIGQNFSSALLVVIDNSRLSLTMDNDALRVLQVTQDGDWKEKDRTAFSLESGSLHAAATLIQQRAYQDLVDFDNHLDDISLDWRNPHFNEMVQSALH